MEATNAERERILRRQIDKIHEARVERALEFELERLRQIIRDMGEEPWA